MNSEDKQNDLTRRSFLKWTAGGLLGAGALTAGIRPWEKSAKGVTVSQRRPAMGTFVEITARGQKEKKVNDFIDKAYDRIAKVDETMSVFKGGSRVYRLNEPGTKRTSLTPEMAEVLLEGQKISRKTGGSFDVTAAPLLDLWGFYGSELNVPTDKELETTLELVDYRNLSVDAEEGTASLADPRAAIDLGGIAKGYGVDQAVEVLKDGGLSAGLVNAGGDIRGFGSPEAGRDWKVGLQHPLKKNDLLSALKLYLPAVTTSGNYESFFTYQGSKLAHIIDPVTGRPVEDVLSVSVLTERAVKADGLSTGAFSQKPEKAIETVEKLDDTEIIYIYRSGSGGINVEVSGGLQDRVDASSYESGLNSSL
ncbi:FAD:protein FMN transferase [Candidatus Bipolaricaulota bacterium]|nr:FAD:protein FMN transferase [Candidatus Bipolaricaulota bacterium]